MSQTQSLGPARGRASEEELDATQTVFGRFLLALRAYTTTDQPVAGKAVVWCDDPTDHIVLASMSVLLPSFASQASLEMHTAMQVSEVAERLNRRLTAGIVINYQTPEAAAKAFYEQVILTVHRAHTLGYRPGMELTLSTWKLLLDGRDQAFVQALPKGHDPSTIADLTTYYAAPATLFFAPLLKSARELKERLRIETAHLHRLNEIDLELQITCAGSASLVEVVSRSVLGYLDESRPGSSREPDALLGIEHRVSEAIALCEVLNAFRVNFSDWSQLGVSLDQEWLCSQILLSFTDEPPQTDIIPNLGTYQVGLRAVQSASENEVVEAARRRLTQRLPRALRDVWFPRLEGGIRRQVMKMRLWNPAAVDDLMLAGVVMRISEKDFLLDASIARDVATLQNPNLLGEMEDRNLTTPEGLAALGMSIVWEDLSVDHVLRIVEEGVLPDKVIIEGLVRCEPSAKSAGVRALRNREIPETLNLLLRAQLLVPTIDLLREHVEEIDSEILGAYLGDLLEFAVTPKGEIVWEALIKAMARAPAAATIALLDNTIRRAELCSIGVEVLRLVGLKWGLFDQIREHVGDDLFRMWVFGSIAFIRQMTREDLDSDDELDDWEDIFSGDDITLPLRLLGPSMTQRSAKELLREISESKALAWTGLAD